MSQTLPRIDVGAEVAGTGPLESSATSFDTFPVEGVESPFESDSTAEDSYPPVVEIAIPVYNEECILEASVHRLRTYLDESFPFSIDDPHR